MPECQNRCRVSVEYVSKTRHFPPYSPIFKERKKASKNTWRPYIMAERQGFEPWVLLPAHRFSKPTRSTTPASLRKNFLLHFYIFNIL